MSFAKEVTVNRTQSVNASQALYVFFEDIVNMKMTGKEHFQFLARVLNNKTKKNEVAFNFNGAYSLWEVNYRNLRNSIPASKDALLNHLKKEKYFIEKRTARFNNQTNRCVILNPDHPLFPENFKVLLESEAESDFGGSTYGQGFSFGDKD